MRSKICFEPARLCVLLLGLTLLFAAGCAPLVSRDGWLSAPATEGEHLLAAWTSLASGYSSVQGLARVKVKSPEKSASGSQVIIARRPDRLRAETLSAFGTSLLLLTTDGHDLGALVPSQNRYYFGKADADNLGRFTKIPVKPAELVRTLLYNAPVMAYSDLATWALPAGGWVVELSRWGARQELQFDPQQRLVAVRYFEGREPVLTVTYGDFPAGGPVFPQQIGLQLFQYKVEASLTFEELNLDRLPPLDLFRIEPPASVERYNLDLVLYSTDKVGEKR